MRRSDAFTVTVRYHGNGKAPRSGLTGWRFGSDGGFACAAQASRADTFFPCNDHPSDKATRTFRLSASEGYVAAANGGPAGTTPAPTALVRRAYRAAPSAATPSGCRR
ncbi:hypothetical protein ACF1DY_09665 [Streptomyces albus]